MNYTAKGTLCFIGEAKKRTETFTTKEFHIKFLDGKYEQVCSFELNQDRCDLVDDNMLGDEITVHFSLKGREWNGKVFNTLQAWKIEAQEKEVEENQVKEEDDSNGDLPF